MTSEGPPAPRAARPAGRFTTHAVTWEVAMLPVSPPHHATHVGWMPRTAHSAGEVRRAHPSSASRIRDIGPEGVAGLAWNDFGRLWVMVPRKGCQIPPSAMHPGPIP